MNNNNHVSLIEERDRLKSNIDVLQKVFDRVGIEPINLIITARGDSNNPLYDEIKVLEYRLYYYQAVYSELIGLWISECNSSLFNPTDEDIMNFKAKYGEQASKHCSDLGYHRSIGKML